MEYPHDWIEIGVLSPSWLVKSMLDAGLSEDSELSVHFFQSRTEDGASFPCSSVINRLINKTEFVPALREHSVRPLYQAVR